ncbi:hypothetical protein UK23_23850 [Lentzea aerocolonigenes]|uniref:Uncharacterized protein n=1 Tax=Lentzea aerocolonigenes TaxID=68170 RepID=A0A0F0GWG2_LENAE|nr:DUF2786 domain-containing protein [Lentzea aerocolonigenes]KJK46352.1 hypothetical protein UK23_23850 [Lentzea aerocolonigenes]
MATTKTNKAENARNAKARMMEKVRGLLAKAEDSAATQEESQTFYAKAYELMEKYALDAAIVRHKNEEKPEATKHLRFEVSGQGWHGKGRASLVYRVAEASGCQAVTVGNVMNGKNRWVHIVGTASTVTMLELLLPSLLLQAETMGHKAAKEYMKTVRDQFDTAANANIERRVFFRSYLAAFGRGVGEKIEGTRAQAAEKVGEVGALVLVTDAERVKARFDKLFPPATIGKGRADSFGAAGAMAGRRDGRTADTGQTRVNGGKKAVTAKN